MHESAFDKIKRFWNERPIETIVLATLAMTATAKVVDSVNNSMNARSWRKEVNRRDRMT